MDRFADGPKMPSAIASQTENAQPEGLSMSMPNDHQMPKVPEESAEGIVCCSWDELTSLLDTDNQEAFASWLDDQLAELESDLDEYVSDRSRYQGRRS